MAPFDNDNDYFEVEDDDAEWAELFAATIKAEPNSDDDDDDNQMQKGVLTGVNCAKVSEYTVRIPADQFNQLYMIKISPVAKIEPHASVAPTIEILKAIKKTACLRTWGSHVAKHARMLRIAQTIEMSEGQKSEYSKQLANWRVRVMKHDDECMAAYWPVRRRIDDPLWAELFQSRRGGDAKENNFPKQRQHTASMMQAELDRYERVDSKRQQALCDRLVTPGQLHNLLNDGIDTLVEPSPFDQNIPVLKDFQKKSFAKMAVAIKTYGGVILAERMGMGKTAIVIMYLKWHREMMAAKGEHRPALIILPTPLISTWKEAFAKFDPTAKVCVFHESNRYKKCSLDQLRVYDAILTTYGVVTSEWTNLKKAQTTFRYAAAGQEFTWIVASWQFEKSKKSRKPPTLDSISLNTDRPQGMLFAIAFSGLVLDEAHCIKDAHAARALACLDVDADYRILMTGTPIQNRIREAYSLLRLIALHPLSRVDVFEACFGQKRMSEPDQCLSRTRIFAFMLRTALVRSEQAQDMPKAVYRRLTHDLCDRDAGYQQLSAILWNAGTVSKEKQDGQGLLKLITRARMYAVHQDLPNAQYKERSKDDFDEYNGNEDMALFIRETCHKRRLAVGEEGLRRAIHASTEQQPDFAERRAKFQKAFEDKPGKWCSDRMRRVVGIIDEVITTEEARAREFEDQAERNEYRAHAKILVFHENIAPLDILEIGLKRSNVAYCRFDSTVDQQAVLAQFEEHGKDFRDPDVKPDKARVMLCTTRSTAEGLNLVHAAHVIFLAPCWNPATEAQCVGRAARFGNPRDVVVYKLLAHDSIEDMIVMRQKSKGEIVKRVLDMPGLREHSEKLRALTQEQLLQELDTSARDLSRLFEEGE